MRVRRAALLWSMLSSLLLSSLILSIGLALGCGKYGPPVRVYERPAASDTGGATDEDDESESRPDQP